MGHISKHIGMYWIVSGDSGVVRRREVRAFAYSCLPPIPPSTHTCAYSCAPYHLQRHKKSKFSCQYTFPTKCVNRFRDLHAKVQNCLQTFQTLKKLSRLYFLKCPDIVLELWPPSTHIKPILMAT